MLKHTNHSPRRAGFTLVEMLVAAAVSILLMVIITGAFTQGLDMFRKLRAQAKLQDTMRQAGTTIKDDLSWNHFQMPSQNGTAGYGDDTAYVRGQDLTDTRTGRRRRMAISTSSTATTPRAAAIHSCSTAPTRSAIRSPAPRLTRFLSRCNGHPPARIRCSGRWTCCGRPRSCSRNRRIRNRRIYRSRISIRRFRMIRPLGCMDLSIQSTTEKRPFRIRSIRISTCHSQPAGPRSRISSFRTAKRPMARPCLICIALKNCCCRCRIIPRLVSRISLGGGPNGSQVVVGANGGGVAGPIPQGTPYNPEMSRHYQVSPPPNPNAADLRQFNPVANILPPVTYGIRLRRADRTGLELYSRTNDVTQPRFRYGMLPASDRTPRATPPLAPQPPSIHSRSFRNLAGLPQIATQLPGQPLNWRYPVMGDNVGFGVANDPNPAIAVVVRITI